MSNENRISNEARAEAAEAQKIRAVGRRNPVTGEITPLQCPEIVSPEVLDQWISDGAGGGKYFGDMTAADLTAHRKRLELEQDLEELHSLLDCVRPGYKDSEDGSRKKSEEIESD